MPAPITGTDVEIPATPEGTAPERRRPSWWRRLVARGLRGLARGQRNAGGGAAPLRRGGRNA